MVILRLNLDFILMLGFLYLSRLPGYLGEASLLYNKSIFFLCQVILTKAASCIRHEWYHSLQQSHVLLAALILWP